MITYQDLLKVGADEESKINFVYSAIGRWRATDEYRLALRAEKAYRGGDEVLEAAKKMLEKVTGEKIIDEWSANYKIPSNFFYRFTLQKVQYLLGNGVKWGKESTKDKLGNRRYPFDSQIVKVAEAACVDKMAFGFFNNDHIEVFRMTEFVPLPDEEDGAIKAGIRFWQIDDSKPLRATLYEMDGYTEYIRKNGSNGILKPKQAYKYKVRVSDIGGTEIFDGENYPTFPVVPLYGNTKHQSDYAPIESQICAYNLIKSEFCNTIDEASYIYWTLQNAGGMDEIDLQNFVDRLKRLHAVVLDDNVTATPNSLQAPFEARQALLDRLEKDLYRDALALDVANISGGAATATEIKAAYEPLYIKSIDFEYCVIDFINGILDVAGIDDDPTFNRSALVNEAEEIQTLMMAGTALSQEYVTRKILTVLGDGDEADEIINQINAERLNALTSMFEGQKADGMEAEESTENEQRVRNTADQ